MQSETTDPLTLASRAAVAKIDGRHGITPQEHRELSAGVAKLRPELRAAIFAALGEAVHELPSRLANVADVERVTMLLPRGLDAVSFLPPLRAPDRYRIAFGGPLAFVDPEWRDLVRAADLERRAVLPANVQAHGDALRAWFEIGPETWPDLRKVMALLQIRERGESVLPRQHVSENLFAPTAGAALVSLSAQLQGLVSEVVRGEALIGSVWLRVEEARRKGRKGEGGIHFGNGTSHVENLIRATLTDALVMGGTTRATFEARHEALIARIVAMATRAPAPVALDAASLDESEVEVTP